MRARALSTPSPPLTSLNATDTVDQDALITALQAGSPSAIYRRAPEDEATTGNFQIGAASVDVTTPEPLPSDSPLYRLDNVILTPHMSGSASRPPGQISCLCFSR